MAKEQSARRGQSFVEILSAMAVGIVFVIGVAAGIAPSLRTREKTAKVQMSAALGKELLDNLRVYAESDWNKLADLQSGSANPYYVNTTSSPFAVTTGTEAVVISTTTYARYFFVSPVSRDASGKATTTGGTNDPSTKRVTVVYGWSGGPTTTMATYFTRWTNAAYVQTDWSGGPGFPGPATSTDDRYASSSNAWTTSTHAGDPQAGSVFGPDTGLTAGLVDSTTFDTGSAGGAQYHALMWRGTFVATSGEVKFQIAGANAAGGPWTFLGPDGTPNTFYGGVQDASIPFSYSAHNDQRYFRYRMTLATTTPRVDEVVVLWSR